MEDIVHVIVDYGVLVVIAGIFLFDRLAAGAQRFSSQHFHGVDKARADCFVPLNQRQFGAA